MLRTFPPLHDLIAPILGAPYAQYECWGLAAYLFKQGWGIDLAQDSESLTREFVEVWFRGEAPPLELVLQPWDCLVLSVHGLVGDHCGIVLDAQTFVHTRRTAGVTIDRLLRWQPKIVQVARLRRLV
jgi:cell wall-associated NlpC family hydrolase